MMVLFSTQAFCSTYASYYIPDILIGASIIGLVEISYKSYSKYFESYFIYAEGDSAKVSGMKIILPVIALSRLDFPDPTLPTTVINSPFRTLKSI